MGRPGMMTGKLPPKDHPKTLLLESILAKTSYTLPDPKTKRAWEYAVPDGKWEMFGNDKVGNCTAASKAHILMAVTANTSTLIVPTLDDVMSLYSGVTGYDPSKYDPATDSNPTDTGAAMTDVYDYMMKNGFAGRKILGWVKIDHTNRARFELCVELFGACDTGVQLPNSAMDQFNAGENWDVVPNDGGIDGGHDVPYLGYGSEGETCITWARRQPTGLDWFTKYADEGYGILWEDFFDSAGVAPNKFIRDALWQDLKAMAG